MDHLAVFYKTSPSRPNIKNVNTPQIDISKHKVQMSYHIQGMVLDSFKGCMGYLGKSASDTIVEVSQGEGTASI